MIYMTFFLSNLGLNDLHVTSAYGSLSTKKMLSEKHSYCRYQHLDSKLLCFGNVNPTFCIAEEQLGEKKKKGKK